MTETLEALRDALDVHITEEYRLGPSHIGLRVCGGVNNVCELCALGSPKSKLIRGENHGHVPSEKIVKFAAWHRRNPFGGQR